MNLVLGVDGGGTKTLARVFHTGPTGLLCVLGSGQSTGSNPYSLGWDAAERAIQSAIGSAVADLESVQIDSAVLAVAGCATAEARDRLRDWGVRQAFAKRVEVVPDTEPVLALAPPGAAALGLIAGTGSAVLLRGADGETALLGGWGYLVDDAGSGYALGRDALRHAASLADANAPPDALATAVMERAGVERPERLKQALYGADDPRGWAAQLARTVLGLAESGNPAAAAIVARGVQSLSVLVKLASDRLAARERPPLFLAGGLLNGSSYYRRRLTELLLADGWSADRILLAPDGACGCARLAVGR